MKRVLRSCHFFLYGLHFSYSISTFRASYYYRYYYCCHQEMYFFNNIYVLDEMYGHNIRVIS